MAEIIKVGSPRMREAFEEGLENYIPLNGLAHMHEEGGTTAHSLENLHLLTIDNKVTKIEIGKNQGVLVTFEDGDTYLATGFGIGYKGYGPQGFATFASKNGYGTFNEVFQTIQDLPQDWTGVIGFQF